MDVFSQYRGLKAQQTDSHSENPSTSETGTGTGTTISCCTDEDIMLASSHPKKRTGRKKFKETRHPVYRGVRMRNSNRWVCEVREPNKRNRIWLGTYPTAEMAARAHDVAALALRGLKGCLNFADSAWRLPKPASNDPEDIQRAAAEAAAMFSIDEEKEEEEDVPMSGTVCNEPPTCDRGKSEESGYYYMDDESIFEMPGLLNYMAEGLLLPPPSSYMESKSEATTWDNYGEQDGNMMLWNHSI